MKIPFTAQLFYCEDIDNIVNMETVQPGMSVSKERARESKISSQGLYQAKKIKMTKYLLKLNYDKTKLIVITTHNYTSHNQHIVINTRELSYYNPWRATSLSESCIWLNM